MAVQIDHVIVPVRDYTTAKRFYEQVLAALGLVVRLDWPDKRKVFFGPDGEPSSLWICESDRAGRLELSLGAPDADAVDRFHHAAVAAGARTEYEPGIRPEYNREYYAARVTDPDGNSLEAVFRGVADRRPLAA
jgi:catechol 2,3-dioxygenase-like lactoylglutathione lyase family enzyme